MENANPLPYLKASFLSAVIATQGCWYYEIVYQNQRLKVFTLKDGSYSIDDLELMAIFHALATRKHACELELHVNSPFNHMILTELQAGNKLKDATSVDLTKLKAALDRHKVYILLATDIIEKTANGG